MVRPTYQEMIAIENTVFLIIPTRRGHAMPHRAMQKSTRVSQEARVRDDLSTKPSLWFA